MLKVHWRRLRRRFRSRPKPPKASSPIKPLKIYWWKLRHSLRSKPKESVGPTLVNRTVEQKSSQIVNLVGYTILFLALLEYASLLIPAKFFDPSWEMQTAGRLIERVWAPLFGFLLIFYRRYQDLIKPGELRLLSVLSWLALLLGIVHFLTVPLIIGNAIRINRSQQAQLIGQIHTQKTQVQQYTQQLNQASYEQLSTLQQNASQQAPEIASSPQEFKEGLLTQLNQKQQAAQKKLQSDFSQKKKGLFKTSVKWIIGAIVSSTSLILIWKHTKWARTLRSSRRQSQDPVAAQQ